MESDTLSHHQLLRDYKDLQLRVTQFSKVEQELINTRDRLDQELLMYRRLSEFNHAALEVENNEQLIKLFVESIVDIFETESAIIAFTDLNSKDNVQIFTEGFKDNLLIQTEEFENSLRKLNKAAIHQTIILDEQVFEQLPGLNFCHSGLYKEVENLASGYRLQIFALISREYKPLYLKIEDRHLTIFEVFCQQVQALYENKRNAEIIKQQYEKIKVSGKELLKLSKIATESRNGVVITNSQGCIEWINGAFTEITGYKLNEVIGLKPKQFLQGPETQAKDLKFLSNRLKQQEPVEITLINYRKSGESYYNALQITPIFNEDKELINFISLQRDITQEIRSTEELRRIHNKLEVVTQKSQIGIWELNPVTFEFTCNEVMMAQLEIEHLPTPLNYRNHLRLLIDAHDLPRAALRFTQFASTNNDYYEDEISAWTSKNKQKKQFKIAVIATRHPSGQIQQLMGTSIDVTEQRQNEAKLQENLRQQILLSEASLALNTPETFEERINKALKLIGENTSVSRVYIFENSKDGLFCHNTYEWCNANIASQIENLQNVPYDLIPYWRDELISAGIIYAENLNTLPEEVRQMLEPQSIKSILILPLLSQGNFKGFIGFDECVHPKKWTRGEIELLRAFSGMVSNALEREHSEKSILISEQKYRGIIEHMNLGLVETDNSGAITYKNRKFSELTSSIDPSLLAIGVDLNSKLTEAEKNGKLLSYRLLDRSVYEINFLNQEQKPTALMVSHGPITSGDELKGHIGIYLDISTVKDLQSSLENAVAERDGFIQKVNSLKIFYENILNEAPYEIIVLDENLKPSFVNRMAQLHPVFSVMRDGIGTNNLATELLGAVIQNALQSKQLKIEEERVVSKDGHLKHILRSVLPCYDELGQLENVIITGTDITAIKQIEESLTLKNQELRKINTELDTFVYSVSHDLRAPLLSIKGVMSLIQKSGPFQGKTEVYLNHISQAVSKLDDSIREILDYSRNARTEVVFVPIDIRAMTQSVYEDLMYIREKPVKFTTNYVGDTIIYTDRARIHTVLKNILSNAFKYLRSDIEGYVSLNMTQAKNMTTIQITDNGEGIDALHLPKVFDMFYRASSRANGTGLGLYLCREIMTKLNGKIKIDSKLGEGTVVTIEIPNNYAE